MNGYYGNSGGSYSNQKQGVEHLCGRAFPPGTIFVTTASESTKKTKDKWTISSLLICLVVLMICIPVLIAWFVIQTVGNGFAILATHLKRMKKTFLGGR